MGMDAADLLRALKKDEVFANDLEGVKLGQCAVLVHTKRIAGDEPTVEDEALAKPLKGIKTIGDLASGATTLFIRVELPPTAGEGSCPCSPLTCSPRHALTYEWRSGV